MNREDIIKLAREASNNASGLYEEGEDLVMLYLDELERFAELVRAAEREVCIDLVAMYGGPVDLEAAIRARGETK